MIEQISQILNDPERMAEISEIVSAMGLQNNENISSATASIPEGITNFLNTAQKRDEKQQALVRALLPYLRPNHQKKLEQAINIAKITHWAGITLQTQEQISSKEEQLDL